jgi:hypothetical protein
MPDEIGNVILSSDIGESRSDSDFVSVSSLTGGTSESENVVFGEPDSTNNFRPSFDGNSGDRGNSGPRLTKRGTIDGRTTRRNRTSGNDFVPQNATNGVTDKPGKPLSLENVLMNIHLILSEIADIPELKLEKDEAKDYGAALFEVQKEYGVAFSSKANALVNLAGVMGKIYVPMGIQVRNRLKGGKPSVVNVSRETQPVRKAPIEMKPNGSPPVPVSTPNMSPSDLFGSQEAGLGSSAL